jgi:protease-4
VLPLVLLVFAGLFILGGWLISSFNQFASSMTSTAQMQFTEVTLRSGETDNRIAVIDLTGVITSYGPSDMVVNFKKQLELAGEDSRVKAVIIRIDSPGGEVMASDEIARAIREFEQDESIDKPVIASMGGMAASGGYYIAAPCRLIFANKLTITGSIGVIMQSVNFHGLMDKVGVKPVTFKSGKNKDMLSSFNPPEAVTPEQKEILQGFINETYQIFVDVVSEGRANDKARSAGELKSDIRELVDGWEEYADGRILTGKEAYEYGMVDKLGNFDDAVKFTEQYLGIEEGKSRLVRNEPPMSFGNLFSLLGQAKETALPATIKVDIGLDIPQLRPGVPYYISSHLYSE